MSLLPFRLAERTACNSFKVRDFSHMTRRETTTRFGLTSLSATNSSTELATEKGCKLRVGPQLAQVSIVPTETTTRGASVTASVKAC